MSERDWELEFEDFDWSTTEGDATNGAELDADLLELFSGFDSIHAEDDLQAATLGVIFAQVDDETAASEFNATDTMAQAVIDAPMTQAANTKRSRRARQNNGDAHARHLARPRRRWVPAFVACLALVIVGIVSWFVPVTSVAVTQDDLSIVLGVNMYGVAVSTKGEGELDKRVIEKANAANARYEDALGKILDAYGAVQNDNGASLAKVSVDVRSPIGIQTDGMLHAAQRVVQERMPPSNELNGSARPVNAPTGGGPSGSGPSGNGQSEVGQPGSGSSGSGPSGGEQFYRPVSDTPNDSATSGEHRWGDNRFSGVPNGNNVSAPSNPGPGNNDTAASTDSTLSGQAPSQPEQMDGTTQQSNPEVSHNTDPANTPLDEGQSVAQAPAQQDASPQDVSQQGPAQQDASEQDVSQQNPAQQDAPQQEAWPQESAP